MTAKTIKLSDIKTKALAQPDVQAEYEALRDEFTQQELADRSGIKQPQLARLETGKQLPRLDTLATLAAQAGYDLQIEFVPKVATGSELPKLEMVTISGK
jgi:transcriptional regulator with XRE-family HTH domain